jgi:DNA polymerase III epsilon subunit-like protein
MSDTHVGDKWTHIELTKLIQLYNHDKKDVIEIAKIHKRTPYGIIAQLIKHKIITDKKQARGYDLYIQTTKSDKSLTTTNSQSQINSDEVSKLITLDNVEYYLSGDTLYNVNKVKGDMVGFYDTSTNSILKLTDATKQIISYLKNKKDNLIVLYIGSNYTLIKNHLSNHSNLTIIQKHSTKVNVCIVDNWVPQLAIDLTTLCDSLDSLGELLIFSDNFGPTNPLVNNINMKCVELHSYYIRAIKKITKMSGSGLTMILDTETTGFPSSSNPQEITKFNNARLIELGYILYDNNQNEIKQYNSLVKPNEFFITNNFVHGITQQNALSKGRDVSEVLSDLLNDLINVDVIICHNISFDMNILLSEAYRANKPALVKSIETKSKICTMETGKKFMKLNKLPKMIELYKLLNNGKEISQDHRALSDCVICAECYYQMTY